jgi:hypothetical protein
METFKRYLFFQLMMFVFGIVGPIFLILFFTTAPAPDMKWAYWAGLIITTADVLIALALTKSTEADKKNDKPPADMRIAVAVARRMSRSRGIGQDHVSSSD